MGMFKEFKEFAMRGNVLDLAVGVVIGGAFGKIVSSAVADLIMPPLGLVLGGVKFTEIKVVLKQAALGADGKELPAVTLNMGNFIQAVVDFTIVAFAIFLLVKGVNTVRRRWIAEPETAPAPPEPTAEVKLLTEIRDLLKNP